jgi:hypothetical protein
MTVAGRQGFGARAEQRRCRRRLWTGFEADFGLSESRGNAEATPDWSGRGDADAGFGPVLKPILVSWTRGRLSKVADC